MIKKTESKIVIQEEYSELGKEVLEDIDKMYLCSIEELRLWIISELSMVDSECWWLVDIGIAILKEKMEVLNSSQP